mgnify:CR=1 FL=1
MSNNQQIVMNRIKVTLVEKQRTNRWLAEQMGKSENTISRWCSNKSQPSLEDLFRIAELLEVDYTDLIRNISRYLLSVKI